jgi:hypothetical protein
LIFSAPLVSAVTVLTEQVVKLRLLAPAVRVRSELVLLAPASRLLPAAVAELLAVVAEVVVPAALLPVVQPDD